MNKEIYFDCASTVKVEKEVLDTFSNVSNQYYANSSSTHRLGIEADEILSKAREQIARYLCVKKDEIIFLSSATEANNLAIQGVCNRNSKRGKRIITTAAEHPSVMEVFKQKEKEGFDVHYLNYDKYGNIDLNQLNNLLTKDVILVSMMKVNNETGYIFDTDKAYKMVKEKTDAFFHIDATQAIGKEKIDSSYYDLLSMSGHKIGGIKGSGLLVKKKDVLLSPILFGGGQEDGYRSSTVSTPLCASLATAIRLAYSTFDKRREKALKINSYLRENLKKIDEVEIISPIDATPYILSFALKKHKASIISEDLSNHNIFISTKSACSSKEKGYSYVIKNAGYSQLLAENSIRLSFSGKEEIEEGEIFIQELKSSLSRILEDRHEQ